MHDRRNNIIARHAEILPQWKDIKDVLNVLGPCSMSSDESDSELSTIQHKHVRRISLPWLNPSISDLFRAVDTYIEDPLGGFPVLNIHDRRRNRPFPRTYAATKVNTTRRPMVGLPINFYCPSWWSRLSRHQQRNLCPGPALNIPSLVGSSCIVSSDFLMPLFV